MDTFEIIIQRKAGPVWPIVAETSRPGQFLPVRHEGVLQIEPDELNTLIDPLEYGITLGRAVFQDLIRDGFVQALSSVNKAAQGSDPVLRVLLSIEDDELRSLRWERLAAPFDGNWDFLALNQNTPFSLYLPSLADRRFPPIGRRDLRALVVIANPQDLDEYELARFDAQAAWKSVHTAMGDIPTTLLAYMEESVGPPTLDAIITQITTSRTTLLHIVCHGRVRTKDGETVLYLGKKSDDPPDGQVDPVTASELIRRLRQLKSLPQFTFLATCESADPRAENGLGGLGQRLVRELGMPAVLAMTGPVSVDTSFQLSSIFYARLVEHGEVDRALVQAQTQLASRDDITVPALFSRLGGRPLFSDKLDRPLTGDEIRYGLKQLHILLQERAPVLLPEFDHNRKILDATLSSDSSALGQTAAKERSDVLEMMNSLCDEAIEFSFNALALGQTPPKHDARCPFRGLFPFRAEDRAFFFGREELVARLLERIQQHSFLAILGPSGCGKSSLVLAGLAPALGSQVIYLTPGSDPITQLATALSTAENSSSAQLSTKPALVVVDQFEELFTLTIDESRRQEFIQRLLELPKNYTVVITMRADFWGECAPYPTLRQEMQAHQELVAPMDSIELRKAIEQQAASTGLRFEAGLASNILDDVHNEPGAMPLLQHALLLLWERRHGRWLRTEEYQNIGGVQRAIAGTADQIYLELSPTEQEQVRDIFLRLTRLDPDASVGQDHRDTRRRMRLRDLAPAGGQLGNTQMLIKRLADARLVVTSLDPASDEDEVQVAHEALIRYWPRLREWLNEDRASLRLREGVNEAAQEWRAHDQDQNLLVHRGNRLDEALSLQNHSRYKLNDLETSYLQACLVARQREQEEKEAQQRRELEAAQKLAEAERHRAEEQTQNAARLRQRAVGLGIALLVAAIMMVLAFVGFGFSNKNAAEARRQAETAEAFSNLAEQQKATAIFNRSQAEANAATAQAASELALAQKATAQANEAEAKRQAALALSRQTAAQSLSAVVANQLDSAMLFGIQANRFADTVQARSALLTALQANPRLERVLSGQSDYVLAMSYRPDSQVLATGGCQEFNNSREKCLRGEIILWNPVNGRQVGVPWTDHTNTITRIRFSPDSRLMAVASLDGKLTLRDASDGAPVEQPLIDNGEEIIDLAFSPDSRLLTAIDSGFNITRWDTKSRQVIDLTAPDLPQELQAISISPDGRRLAYREKAGQVVLWDLETGVQTSEIRTIEAGGSLIFLPDSQKLASINGTQVSIYDAASGQRIGQITTSHTKPIKRMAFSPDGQAVATVNEDGIVRINRVPSISYESIADNEELSLPIIGHNDLITSLSFNPEGNILATGSRDHLIFLWNWTHEASLAEKLAGTEEPITALAASSDGSTLAVGSCRQRASDGSCGKGQVILLDSTNGKPLETPLAGHNNLVNSLAFDSSRNMLASGSWDGAIIIWNMATRQPTGSPIQAHSDFVTGLAFTPDGQTLASSSRDGSVRLWDTTTRKAIGAALKGHKSRVLDLDINPTGQILASAGQDSTVILWEIKSTPVISQTLEGHTKQVNTVKFSPDGAILASAGADSLIRIWDLQGKLVKLLSGHTGSVTGISFNHDGSLLASTGQDGRLILWDVNSGQQIGTPFTTQAIAPADILRQAAPSFVETLSSLQDSESMGGVVFLPNQDIIITASRDDLLRRWDIRLESWIERACSVAARSFSDQEWQQILPGEPKSDVCRLHNSQ